MAHGSPMGGGGGPHQITAQPIGAAVLRAFCRVADPTAFLERSLMLAAAPHGARVDGARPGPAVPALNSRLQLSWPDCVIQCCTQRPARRGQQAAAAPPPRRRRPLAKAAASSSGSGSRSTEASGGAKRVVITGGTKGLGYAMAQEFLRAGDSVALCGRSADRVAAAVAALQAEHGRGRVHGAACDVSSPADMQQSLGGADLWLNNAGERGGAQWSAGAA